MLSVLGLDSGYKPSGVPSGTPSGKRIYLTIYPTSCPNTDTKCVCKSQNRKCVCKSQNSHIQSISEGVDRGVLTMVCNGPCWYPVD